MQWHMLKLKLIQIQLLKLSNNSIKNVTLRAEERNDDLYAGIDLINNKLERQVRKYKTRINRKSRDRGDQKCLLPNYRNARNTS